MKKVIVLLIVMSLSFAVFAQGASEAKSGTGSAVQDYGTIPARMSIGTSPTGQAAYQMGAAISDVVNKAGIGTTLTTEETGGFPVNVQLLMNDEIEFGIINNMMEEQVYAATGAYSQYQAHKVLSVLNLGPAEMHIIVPANSDIQSVYDFKGHRVGVGQPGGIVLDVSNMFLEALGYKEGDFQRFEIKLANQCDYLADGQLDVVMWIGTAALPAVSQLIATKDVRFIEIDDAAIAAMQKACSVIEKTVIKANTYAGQTKDIQTFCTRQILVASKDVSNEAVYQVTKLILENVDALKAIYPALGIISKDTALLGFNENTPLHPGAARYYKEIGLNVDSIVEK